MLINGFEGDIAVIVHVLQTQLKEYRLLEPNINSWNQIM
jgi:hypothetical protein